MYKFKQLNNVKNIEDMQKNRNKSWKGHKSAIK